MKNITLSQEDYEKELKWVKEDYESNKTSFSYYQKRKDTLKKELL